MRMTHTYTNVCMSKSNYKYVFFSLNCYTEYQKAACLRQKKPQKVLKKKLKQL